MNKKEKLEKIIFVLKDYLDCLNHDINHIDLFEPEDTIEELIEELKNIK